MGIDWNLGMARAISVVLIATIVAVQQIEAHTSAQEASLAAESNLGLLDEVRVSPPAEATDAPPKGVHKKTVDVLRPPAAAEDTGANFDNETQKKVLEAFEDTKRETSVNNGALDLNQKHLSASTEKLRKSQETLKQFMLTDVQELPADNAKNETSAKKKAEAQPGADSDPEAQTAQEQATNTEVEAADAQVKAVAETQAAQLAKKEAMEVEESSKRQAERAKARAARQVDRAKAQKKQEIQEAKADMEKKTARVQRKAKRVEARMQRKLKRVVAEEERKVQSMKTTLEQKAEILTKKSEAAVEAANSRASALKVQLDLLRAKSANKAAAAPGGNKTLS